MEPIQKQYPVKFVGGEGSEGSDLEKEIMRMKQTHHISIEVQFGRPHDVVIVTYTPKTSK